MLHVDCARVSVSNPFFQCVKLVMNEDDLIGRERTSHEKRRWVRLTRTCNNNCLFCLDADIRGKKVRGTDEVRKEIEDGIEEGCERLILSGGEPTLHPDYVDFIALGERLGYGWIQTVTNGRMFAYREFARRAVAAGLDEATFSLHGHRPELHDELVGVEGAFEQSTRGMQNLLKQGIVVNVDVVLNALNVPVLDDILQFYIARGIREFDLLWMVPFGAAWRNRSRLFPDRTDALKSLHQAIGNARRKGVVIWTNRLPAGLLEGHEYLVQDPHKIHDEVRGRRPEFERFLRTGEVLECFQPQRCGQCPMQNFCQNLFELVGGLQKGRVPDIAVDLGREPSPGQVELSSRSRALRLRTSDMQRASAFLDRLEPRQRKLVIELTDSGEPDTRSIEFDASVRPARVASASPAVLDRLLAGVGMNVEIMLNRATAAWLGENAAALAEQRDSTWFVSLEKFDTLEALTRTGCDPVEALGRLEQPAKLGLLDLPPCALPRAGFRVGEKWLPIEVLPDGRHPDLTVFTEHFIRNEFNVHSLRCDDCTQKRTCPGWPLNLVRSLSFSSLCRPIGADEASPDFYNPHD